MDTYNGANATDTARSTGSGLAEPGGQRAVRMANPGSGKGALFAPKEPSCTDLVGLRRRVVCRVDRTTWAMHRIDNAKWIARISQQAVSSGAIPSASALHAIASQRVCGVPHEPAEVLNFTQELNRRKQQESLQRSLVEEQQRQLRNLSVPRAKDILLPYRTVFDRVRVYT